VSRSAIAAVRSVGGRVVMNKSIIKPRAELTACECNMTDTQLAQLKEVLELAKTTEQKAKELAQFILEIDRKYEQRLAQIRVARKLQP
jgi:hypothetical protein